MNPMKNFCNWTDANAFMRDCFKVDGERTMPDDEFFSTARRLESPLELVMLSAVYAAKRSMRFHESTGAEMVQYLLRDKGLAYVLRAAVPIGSYRADMVLQAEFEEGIFPSGKAPAAVVIECDGFNYHDKTREQACRDRARDRYMQREGFVVARLAGDEILERPFECVFDVFDLALRGIVTVNRDVHQNGGWPVFMRRNEGRDIGPMNIEDYLLKAEAN